MLSQAQQPPLAEQNREELHQKIANELSVIAAGRRMVEFYRGLCR